jgi:hypothetical protein
MRLFLFYPYNKQGYLEFYLKSFIFLSKASEKTVETPLVEEPSRINDCLKFVESIVDVAFDKRIVSITNENFRKKNVSRN